MEMPSPRWFVHDDANSHRNGRPSRAGTTVSNSLLTSVGHYGATGRPGKRFAPLAGRFTPVRGEDHIGMR